jgi:hypothetical protein
LLLPPFHPIEVLVEGVGQQFQMKVASRRMDQPSPSILQLAAVEVEEAGFLSLGEVEVEAGAAAGAARLFSFPSNLISLSPFSLLLRMVKVEVGASEVVAEVVAEQPGKYNICDIIFRSCYSNFIFDAMRRGF